MIKLSPEDLWEVARDLGEAMVDHGTEPEVAAALIAETLDDLVDLTEFLPGAAGLVLETVDRPLIEKLIGVLLAMFTVDPNKRAARKNHRRIRRAKRRARREARHG